MYTISSKGIQDIKREEGERFKAYKDVVGYWTTGVGHKIKSDETHLLATILTPEQSHEIFINDLQPVIESINKRLKVPVHQNVVDSLAGFLFNAGRNAGDGLFDLINSNADKNQIFNWWTSHYVTAKGQVLPQLQQRRIREATNALSINNQTAVNSTSAPDNESGNNFAPLIILGMAGLLFLANKKSR